MEPQQEKLQYSLKEFDGPLDLLLYLIKRSEVSLYDIPVAEITKQYLEHLERGEADNLEIATEFFVMAATLLYLKSRMLLPVEVNLDSELDDPRVELVEQLIEYQKFKKFTELIEEKEKAYDWSIERVERERVILFDDKGSEWEEISPKELHHHFSKIVRSISSEKVLNLLEETSVNEKLTLIDELLTEKKAFSFRELIKNQTSLFEVICSFLAILEAARTKDVLIMQNRVYGEIKIMVYRRAESHGTTERESSY